MNNYLECLVTYTEQPTQEAVKAAEMVNRYMFWMANQVNKKHLINAFGNILGSHYWDKIVRNRTNTNYQSSIDMMFWFELDNINRQKLMHYILKSGYKGK